MGLRFGKRIRLGKFITLNLSKSGISASFGVRGAKLTIGPRGTQATVGLPGSGLSYTKKLSGSSRNKRNSPEARAARGDQAAPPPAREPVYREAEAPAEPEDFAPPAPGLLAPRHEKIFAQGLESFRAGDDGEALACFLEAAPHEAGAAVLAAALMSTEEPDSIPLLESVVLNDVEFPTPLMERYLVDQEVLLMSITHFSEAEIGVDSLGATLLLAEAYQAQGRPDDAIGLLEEVHEVSEEPTVMLSLCELYATNGHWDALVEVGQNLPAVDDVTYEINYFYGVALGQRGLYDAARTVFSDALRRKNGKNERLTLEFLYARATAYEALNQRARARKDLETVYMLDTSFRDVAARLDSMLS
ncbi:MAG TPA: DUF4236 domain-containing protein [Herpetosiphonaceae bacterium]